MLGEMEHEQEVGSASLTDIEDEDLFELETLGYRYGSNCREIRLPANSFVNYMEISYDQVSLQILSAFFNFKKLKAFEGEAIVVEDSRALLGDRSKEDGTKGWFFTEEK